MRDAGDYIAEELMKLKETFKNITVSEEYTHTANKKPILLQAVVKYNNITNIPIAYVIDRVILVYNFDEKSDKYVLKEKIEVNDEDIIKDEYKVDEEQKGTFNSIGYSKPLLDIKHDHAIKLVETRIAGKKEYKIEIHSYLPHILKLMKKENNKNH
jgi:hypothetical protein